MKEAVACTHPSAAVETSVKGNAPASLGYPLSTALLNVMPRGISPVSVSVPPSCGGGGYVFPKGNTQNDAVDHVLIVAGAKPPET